MVFSTLFFATVFLPAVLASCWLLERVLRRTRLAPWPAVNALILGFSLAFYFWGEGKGVLWLCASIVFNDVSARLIARQDAPARRKAFLAVAVAGNLAFLGWFKYAGFLVSALNVLPGVALHVPKVALPLGISFYTFQAMSYVIDVFRRDVAPSPTPLGFACYLTMFPQLVAGPIVRYADIAAALSRRDTSLARVSSGMRRFLLGLSKKVLVANSVAAFADSAWGYADKGLVLPLDMAWLALAAYALQIYYDFSGYSDMAVGIGRMLGFDFPENFRHPYCSASVREFWRRWHISLSTWFRDYLYIPLGGNRRGTARTCLNSLVVFALCGLWHGAGTTFLIWGLWHGLFLTIERLAGRGRGADAPRTGAADLLAKTAGRLYTAAVFLAGWVFFRSDTFAAAGTVFKSLAGAAPAARETMLLYVDASPKLLLATAVGIVFAFPAVPAARAWLDRRLGADHPFQEAVGWAAVTCTALLALLFMAGGSYNPFIYFRF